VRKALTDACCDLTRLTVLCKRTCVCKEPRKAASSAKAID
jgi:hypothetical protein